MAAMLGAILLGAATGSGEAIQGAIAAAQGVSAQQQINFTRGNEYEADRVGVGLLASAGFDPMGMSDLFRNSGASVRTSGEPGAGVPADTPGDRQSNSREPGARRRIPAPRGRGRHRLQPRAGAAPRAVEPHTRGGHRSISPET